MKKLLSVILALALVLCCTWSALQVAVSALPADREVVSEFTVTMLDDYVPKAGQPIKQNKCMFSVSSGRQYYVKGNDRWCSSEVKKSDGYYGQPTYWEMAPDHDYSSAADDYIPGSPVFEPGQTYYLRLTVVISDGWKDQFCVNSAQGAYNKLSISNLSSASYTVENFKGDGSYFGIVFLVAFKVTGTPAYNDIDNVTVWDRMGFLNNQTLIPIKPGTVYAGPRIEPGYGNFKREYDWKYPDSNNKVGDLSPGKTYIRWMKLTAFDGYKFAEDVAINFLQYEDIEPTTAELSSDRKVLYIEYTFTVDDYDRIEVIKVKNSKKNNKEEFCPIGNGSNGNPTSNPRTFLSVDASEAYEFAQSLGCWENACWHDEEDTAYPSGFSTGYLYHFTLEFTRKDSHTRFAAHPELKIEGLEEGVDYIAVEDPENYIYPETYKVSLYFIAGGWAEIKYGKSPEYPIECRSYEGLKFALERPEFKYVRLNGRSGLRTVPLIRRKIDEENPKIINGITVEGEKTLILNGKSTFAAPDVDAQAYCQYQHLITVPFDAYFGVEGDGELVWVANLTKDDQGKQYENCVIYSSGNVCINGGAITGDLQEVHVNTVAVANAMGLLTVNGGTLTSYDSTDGTNTAVEAVGGSTVINGGVFKSEKKLLGGGMNYGFKVYGKKSNTAVEMHGGTFYGMGIKLGTNVDNLYEYCSNDGHRVYAGTFLAGKSGTGAPSSVNQSYIDDVVNRETPLRIVSYVTEVALTAKPPVVGEALSVFDYSSLTDGVNVEEISWYKDGALVNYPGEEYPADGHEYTVTLKIRGDLDKWKLLHDENHVKATINGAKATVAYGGSKTTLKVSYTFKKVGKIIYDIRANYLRLPAEHTKPTTTVPGAGESDKYGIYSYNNGGLKWYKNGEPMDMNEEFQPGECYTVELRVAPKGDYIFDFYDGTPVIVGVINGEYYCGVKADPKNAKGAIIYYDFPALEDNVIEDVEVFFDQPGGGQLPNYEGRTFDQRYKVGPSGDYGYDSWSDQSGLEHRRYYNHNKITYYDITEDGGPTAKNILHDDTPLITGHTYRVCFDLFTTGDAYMFYNSTNPSFNDFNSALCTATVNGNAAVSEEIAFTTNGAWNTTRHVYYDFVCGKPMISVINIKNVKEPKDGGLAEPTGVSAEPELYTVRQAQWLDSQGFVLTGNNEFSAGSIYTIKLTIDAGECDFAPDAVVRVNGYLARATVEDGVIVAEKDFFAEAGGTDFIPGDLNGDGEVTDQDAVYLLFYTFFPDAYPVDQPVDFDGSGEVNDQDAVYLLFYTFFPDAYPLN